MKKIVVILIGLFCLSSVYAQWSVAPEAGMTAVNKVDLEEWRATYKVGAAIEYDFSSLFSVKSGLYYQERGYSFSSGHTSWSEESNTSQSFFYDANINSGYLQLPIAAKFNWGVGKDMRFTIAGGPYLAYRIKTNNTLTATVGSDHGSSDYNGYSNEGGYGYGTGYYSLLIPRPGSGYKFDWGTTVAVGMEVKNWVMNVGYDASFSKQADWDDIDINYHTISLTLGYKFRI